MFEGFDHGRAGIGEIEIAWVAGGRGPAVLLLHGFPQNMALWAEVAPALARAGYCVVCADLRGYGASSKPPLSTDMRSHSFRAMGRDMAGLMTSLGAERFHLIGHDRGARVAHRMALDYPRRVASVAMLDIVPTHTLLTELRREVAKSYYHWFFLAQPSPFPETLIGADPDYYFESCLLGWGASRLEQFGEAQMEAYRAAWNDPETIAQMCHDYRAALTADLADDSSDLRAQVQMPALVLWGRDGAMGRLYDVAEAWEPKCRDLQAEAVPGGHFFVDTDPAGTVERLLKFLDEQPH